MVVCVPAAPHRLDVYQGRSPTSGRELPRDGSGSVEQSGVRTIHRPCRHPHSVTLVAIGLDSGLRGHKGVEGNLVVLYHEGDWQPTGSCKVHRLPELAVAAAALANGSEVKTVY